MIAYKRIPKKVYTERGRIALAHFQEEIITLSIEGNRMAQLNLFISKMENTSANYAQYFLNDTVELHEIQYAHVLYYSFQSLHYINKHYKYYYSSDLKAMQIFELKKQLTSLNRNLINDTNRDFIDKLLDILCESIFHYTRIEEGQVIPNRNYDFSTLIAYKILDVLEEKLNDNNFLQLISPLQIFSNPSLLSILQRYYSQNRQTDFIHNA